MFRQGLVFVLVAGQLSLAIGVKQSFAGEVRTPELGLIERVLTLKGQGLSDRELQVQLEAALTDFNANSAPQGRAERLESALVKLRILTAQQARTFTAGVRQVEAGMASQDFASPQEEAKALRAQLELFSRINPVGVQFSSCAVGWGLAVGGTVAAVAGLLLRNETRTCQVDYSQGYMCEKEHCPACTYSHPACEIACYITWEDCYPTVCDSQEQYPHRQAGTITAIAGGAAAVAGIVILIAGGGC